MKKSWIYFWSQLLPKSVQKISSQAFHSWLQQVANPSPSLGAPSDAGPHLASRQRSHFVCRLYRCGLAGESSGSAEVPALLLLPVNWAADRKFKSM